VWEAALVPGRKIWRGQLAPSISRRENIFKISGGRGGDFGVELGGVLFKSIILASVFFATAEKKGESRPS